jgi:putative ATPase
MAINSAQEVVKKTGNLPVPLHLRNPVTGLMKNLDYGKGYKYAHDYDNNFSVQDYLPENIKASVFYEPGKNQRETEVKNHLKNIWKDYYKYE